MKFLLTTLLLLLFSFCISAQDQYDAEKCKDFIQQNKIVKCWDWIVPLKTTKAEIEKAFGESVSEDKNHYEQTYKTEFGKISISYTTKNDEFVGRCACRLDAGIAVAIYIPLDLSVKVSELGLDLTKLNKTLRWHDGSLIMYESENLGIEIYVFNNRQYELVDYIQYSPVYKKEISSSFQEKLSELRKQIKPLRTNRQQIEKMFGKTEVKDCTSCVYETFDEKIQVDYSTVPCKSSIEGWNVPPDTVLRFTITPRMEIKFSDLNVNQDDYFAYEYSDTLYKFINVRLNKINGMLYKFDTPNESFSVSFEPGEVDSNFRCPCYPKYNLLGKLYTPVESVFFNIFAQDNIKPELDGAFLQGTNSGKPFIIYFIIYLGKDGSKEKYKSFVNKLRKHWEYRGYPPEVVKIINGGTREEFQIEHLILHKEYPPPVPKPDNPAEYCLTKALK